uniref:Uncharacterized protein n=1 Tax=viral metagenome TaxID=1070528 RepID=A0A6C0JSE7_9ZZZZ
MIKAKSTSKSSKTKAVKSKPEVEKNMPKFISLNPLEDPSVTEIYEALCVVNANLKLVFDSSAGGGRGKKKPSGPSTRVHPDDWEPGMCKYTLKLGDDKGLYCGAPVSKPDYGTDELEGIGCSKCIGNAGRKEHLLGLLSGRRGKPGKTARVANPGTKKEAKRGLKSKSADPDFESIKKCNTMRLLAGTRFVFPIRSTLPVGVMNKDGTIRCLNKKDKDELTKLGFSQFMGVRSKTESGLPPYMEDYNKKVLGEDSEDSDASSDESSEEPVKKPSKSNKKSAKPVPKKASKKVVEDSSSDESSEEPVKPAKKSVKPVPKKTAPPKRTNKRKAVEEDSSSDESSEEPVKPAKKVVEDSSSDESSEEPVKPAKKSVKPVPKRPVKPSPKKVVEDSSSDESSEEPSEKAIKPTPKKATKLAPKPKEDSSSDESSNDEPPKEESEKSEPKEEPKPSPKKEVEDSSSDESSNDEPPKEEPSEPKEESEKSEPSEAKEESEKSEPKEEPADEESDESESSSE